MKTVYHPEFAHISQEVPDADVKSWQDAGWRRTPPKAKGEAEQDTTTEEKPEKG